MLILSQHIPSGEPTLVLQDEGGEQPGLQWQVHPMHDGTDAHAVTLFDVPKGRRSLFALSFGNLHCAAHVARCCASAQSGRFGLWQYARRRVLEGAVPRSSQQLPRGSRRR